MPRFIGARNNNIIIVSGQPFSGADKNLNVIEVPAEFDNVSAAELILKFHVRSGAVQPKITNKPADKLKVALVGNYAMACGIATYNQHLFPEIKKLVGDVKLFIEQNDFIIDSIYKFGNETLPIEKVSACWKRGQPLNRLIQEIKEYEPDVVLISHEYGLFSNVRYFLSFLHQISDFRPIVTMHSVFHHRDKTIAEAAIPEIVVHLESAKKVLKEEKQINSKVYVIPHGCYEMTSGEQLWNFYKSDHTFMQNGFAFKYKNFEDSLKAVAILKKKYDDVFFTGLLSESPHAPLEHQMYYLELIKLADELDVRDNVCLLRGFQSENTIDSYIRTNQVAVFPYRSTPGHECHGASGAVRQSMSKGIPVITSSIPHFSDVPSVKADTPEDLANELDKLFSNREAKNAQITRQNEYIKQFSWENVAKMYASIFSHVSR